MPLCLKVRWDMKQTKNRNRLRNAIVGGLLSALLVASCASVEIIPPDARLAPPSARILKVAYPTAWSRTIGWFDAHELEITDIDEALGLIQGRLALPDDDTQVDCGRFNINTAITPPKLQKHAKVRVHLSRGFEATSQVLISVTGQYRLDVMDNYAAQVITHTGPCVSLGGIEKQIFNFLTGAS